MSRVFTLLFMIACFCIMSCENKEIISKQKAQVKIHVSSFEIYQTTFPQSAPTTKNAPKISSATNKASINTSTTSPKKASATEANVKSLALCIFNEAGENVFALKQKSTDADFCSATATLSSGKYTLVAIGYGSQIAPDITSKDLVQFTSSNLFDTFCATKTFTIKASQQQDLNITLQRVVSCFQINFTDEIDPKAKTIITTFSKGGKTLQPITALSTSDAGSVCSKTINTAQQSYSAFTFLNADEETMDVQVEIKNEEGKTLYSHNFSNVLFKRNRITSTSGAMFSTETQGTISFENEWLPNHEIPW